MNKWHNSIITFILLSVFFVSIITPASAHPPTPPPPIIIRETQISVSYTEPQKTIVINVTQFDPEQIVKTITLTFKEPMLSISLTIYYLKEKPPEVTEPSGTPLLYFTIRAHQDLFKNIEKAVITFSVEKKIVDEKKIDEKTITLNRFSEDKWEKLSTTKIAEDEKFLYFKAESLGLSHFAVTGITIPPPFPWWIVVIVAIVIAAGIVMWVRMKRKNEEDARQVVMAEKRIIGLMSGEDNSRGHNLDFVLLLVSLVTITWLYTLNQNRVHLEALKQFIHWLSEPKFTYSPLNLNGLLPAILGTVQIVFLGTVVTKRLVPELNDVFEARLVSIAMGFGIVGLTVIVLGYLRALYLIPLLLLLWSLTIVFLVFDFRRKKLYAVRSHLKDCLYLWKPSKPKFKSIWMWPLAIVIPVIFLGIYYHAIMFPPLEFDSIIYHVPMASILFKEHGLPFIAGGGVGLGSSANYPLLFSALGSYYYLCIGFVQDLFLRIITPTMGLLSILATYNLGKEIGGRKLGIISAFLFSMVPSYLSYSSLSTQQTTITFFLVMGVLFLVKAFVEEVKGYWITSGILFGFALLTSYQALYFIPPLFIMLLFYLLLRKRGATPGLSNVKKVFMLVFSMIIIGGSPYLRNWLVLGNPVYPFFNELFKSEFISPWMHEYTKRSWNYVASYIVTGDSTPSVFHLVSYVLVYPSFYPLNFLLIFPATLVFLFSRVRMKHLILAFAYLPFLVIILNQPPFIRYLWLTMPYFSVIVAWMFLRGFEICERLEHHSFINSAKLLKIILVILLLAMMLFPSFVIIGGYAYSFIVPFWPKDSQNYNYLQYTTNPNMDRQSLFNLAYGSDASAWRWLNDHLKDGDRVATFETRIYYIRNANYRAIFSLDNMEAQDLYYIDNMTEALSFLRQNNVKYIFVRSIEEQVELFNLLPLTKFLGSPQFFPIVFEEGLSKIYKVGPLEADPIVVTPTLAYIGPNGWSNITELNGIITRSVKSGSTSPRLYVLTPGLMQVNIQYLDRGHGSLIINLYDPHNKRWIYNYGIVKKEDTESWKSYEFLVPIDMKRGFVELGLYADGEDFVISKIYVNHVKLEDRATLNSLKKVIITNSTIPPSIMIYLPLLKGGERLYLSSYSYGKKISIEIFEGYIPLNITTEWWLKHRMIARSPNLPTFGVENPSLLWEAKPGIYTLIIVLWDEYSPNARVDLSITIGGSG